MIVRLLVSCVLFLLSLTALGQDPTEEKTIDLKNVLKIEIAKPDPKLQDKHGVYRELSLEQCKDFLDHWNVAHSVRSMDYLPDFYLLITFKDGQQRHFTIENGDITEEDWLTYTFKDKMYFHKLWENLK